MKTPVVFLRGVVLALVAATMWTPATLPAQTKDPAKIAELRTKFNEGRKLLDEGKALEALEIFNAVLEEEPKARGSLMMAAIINMNLARFSKAVELLNRFRSLEPNDPNGISMLIQAHQALGNSKDAEAMIKQLKQLRATGGVPGLSEEDMFLRERVSRPDRSTVDIMEFYDYRKKPYRLYMANVTLPHGKLARRLDVAYDPEASKTVRAKDPKFRDAQVFYINEYNFGPDGKLAGVDVYRQVFARPPYDKARDWLIDAVIARPMPMAKGKVENGQVKFPEPVIK